MTPPTSASAPVSPPARIFVAGEWMLVVGLAATVAGTTLGLGGYRAATMAAVAPALFALAGFAGVLFFFLPAARPDFHWAALLPLPFLLYSLASVLWIAPAAWLGWREWLLQCQMWLVFVLALHFGRSPRHVAVWAATFALLGLTAVAMAAYQRFVDPTWIMLGRTQAPQFAGRASGMFGIPNSLAALLELMLPVLLGLLFSSRVRPAGKVVVAWLAALFFFALGLTVSRGGWIALALALLLWPLLARRRWSRRLAGVALVAVVVLGGFWLAYGHNDSARARLDPLLAGSVELSRPGMWRAAWEIWRDQPWLGSGAGSYGLLFDRYRPLRFHGEPVWAHNDYLNLLSDYGVIGLALWAAAAATLLGLGFRAVQRARRVAPETRGAIGSAAWQRGLLLGVVAFALHLVVDFHTHLPALAFALAIWLALLVRDEPGWRRPLPKSAMRIAGLAAAVTAAGMGGWIARPFLQAEAKREHAHRAIDDYALGKGGDLTAIAAAAQRELTDSLALWPTNGQAWSDRAGATVAAWQRPGAPDLATLARAAEADAQRAIDLCPVAPEFWSRRGVALDLQSRPPEAERCFREAIRLAPNNAPGWFYLARHFSTLPGRKAEADEAVETCLSLDPENRAAVALREQLARRN